MRRHRRSRRKQRLYVSVASTVRELRGQRMRPSTLRTKKTTLLALENAKAWLPEAAVRKPWRNEHCCAGLSSVHPSCYLVHSIPLPASRTNTAARRTSTATKDEQAQRETTREQAQRQEGRPLRQRRTTTASSQHHARTPPARFALLVPYSP